jgi:hypothetical protein
MTHGNSGRDDAPTTTPTRRTFLARAAAAGALAAPAMPAAAASAEPSPDAELIAVADEIERLHSLAAAIYAIRRQTDGEAEERTQPELDAIEDRKYELVDRSLVMRAQTRDGLKAKARILLTVCERRLDGVYASNDPTTDAIFSLLGDVLGREVRYGPDLDFSPEAAGVDDESKAEEDVA